MCSAARPRPGTPTVRSGSLGDRAARARPRPTPPQRNPPALEPGSAISAAVPADVPHHEQDKSVLQIRKSAESAGDRAAKGTQIRAGNIDNEFSFSYYPSEFVSAPHSLGVGPRDAGRAAVKKTRGSE